MENRGSAEAHRAGSSPSCGYLPPLTPQSRTTCQQITDDRRPCQKQAPAASTVVHSAAAVGAPQHTPTAKAQVGGAGAEQHGSKHATSKLSSTKAPLNNARRKRKKRREVRKGQAQQGAGLDPGAQALQQQLSDLDTGCAYRKLSTVAAHRVSQFPFPRSHNPVAIPSAVVNDREPYLRHACPEDTQPSRRTIATPDSLDSGVGSAGHIHPSACPGSSARSGSEGQEPPADNSIPWSRPEMYTAFSEHDGHDSVALLEYREQRRKRYQDVQNHRHGCHQQDIELREEERLRTRTVPRPGYGKPPPPHGASTTYKASSTAATRVAERHAAAVNQETRPHAVPLRMPTTVTAKA